MLQQILRDFVDKQNFTLVILAMALLLCRILPVIILSPFLGGEVVPAEVKIGIGLTLGIVLFPAVAPRITEVPTTAIPYIAMLGKELFIGISLAFVVNLVFEAAQAAGTVVDMLAGSNMAQTMVPQIGQQVTLFSSLKVQLAVVLFLTLNGHHYIIEAFADSLVSLPIDQFPKFGKGLWPFFDLIIRIFADLLRIGFILAAPAFVATFLTDLAMGMINRVAPQIQVFFVAMAIKPMVAALVVMVAIHLILARVEDEFVLMLRQMKQALDLLT